ncbi:dolichyl-phosphate beta-glucosyltransferase [Polyrhizophydium stewartii]|uniref:dolichyl-phosphate beta-glucosyltransferase n=1 Tax=Polyrhizophydium stewartii TaxID=2732419 RepID=A0ABR4N129_9FUNG
MHPPLPLPALAALAAAAALLLALAALVLLSPRPRAPTAAERRFTDAASGARRRFPALAAAPTPAGSGDDAKADGDARDAADAAADAPRIALSVVVPAFREEARLPAMLAEAVEYLDRRLDATTTTVAAAKPRTRAAAAAAATSPQFAYEIIIVDDGSGDRTSEVALALARQHAARRPAAQYPRREIRIMTLERNRGKGGAVTQGILASRGDLMLFVDADGASKFADIDKLEAELRSIKRGGRGIAVGSRAHMVNTEAVVKRSFIRNFLMRCFHLAVYILGIKTIKDTQCGFKLFTRDAAADVFPNMHVEGWIFDIEILVIAYSVGIPVVEVPISWHEVDGSKVSLLRDSIQMLVQLLMIRLNYLLGLWSVPSQKPARGAGRAARK